MLICRVGGGNMILLLSGGLLMIASAYAYTSSMHVRLALTLVFTGAAAMSYGFVPDVLTSLGMGAVFTIFVVEMNKTP